MDKSLTEMTPEELRVEINLLRERRLVTRQQAIDENKPKPRGRPRVRNETGTVGMLLDRLVSGSISDDDLDTMMKNIGEL